MNLPHNEFSNIFNHKHMKTKIINILIIFAIVMPMFIFITMNITNEKLVKINENEEENFNDQFGIGKYLNEGISIQGPKQFSLSKDGANNLKGLTFYVNNNTNESVSFPNQGFGMKILFFDLQNQQWKEKIIQKPAEIPQIIPSQFESKNIYYKYSWSIPYWDVHKLNQGRYRIYISGIGQKSNKKYAAYFDVNIIP